MSGMGQTNDGLGWGSESYTTEEPGYIYSTTAEEYPTSTDKWTWGATYPTTTATTTEHYPGESTTSTTHQWIPIITETSTSAQPTTPTASTSQSSATSTTTTSSKNNSSSSSNNTKTIAIAVPVAVVGAIIIAALLFFIFRRRHQRNRNRNRNQRIPQPDVVTVAVPRELQPPPNRSSTWEFAPTNSHDIPFSGPIPGRPIQTTTTTDLDPTTNTNSLTTPLPTIEDPLLLHQHHLAPSNPPPAPAPAPSSQPVISPNIPAWPEQPQNRPTSPFDHPLDDAVSELSHRSRDLDDISSVSSFGEDDERRPAMHHP